MRESTVEKHFREKVEGLGGIAYKFTSPGRRGVPDRMAVLPGGRIFWVELKAPGKKAEPHQLREHKRLRALGFQVDVIDSKEGVDEWVTHITP